ncbi:MAG TPA: hypothetical protein VHI13_17940 [Candidatus Kapabacteria bacterium]|nr:hypothetical protein [Candidatus Kapabacteria bacterium]
MSGISMPCVRSVPRILASSVFMLLFGFAVHAQTFTWATSAGGGLRVYGRKILPDGNGGAYIAGFYVSNVDGPVVCDTVHFPNSTTLSEYALHVDAGGSAQWVKTVETGIFADAVGVGTNVAGDLFFAGQAADIPVHADTAGGTVVRTLGFLARYSPAGGLRWQVYDSAAPRSAYQDVVVERDGGACVVGHWEGTPRRGEIARYAPDGSLRWRVVSSESGEALFRAAALDSSGALVVAGTLLDTVTIDTATVVITDGHYMACTAALDSAGNLLWLRQMAPVSELVLARDVEIDAAGNSYVVLAPQSGSPSRLFKYDRTGNLLWQRSINGAVKGITAEPDGWFEVIGTVPFAATVDTIIATGTPGNGGRDEMAFIARFTPEGRIAWMVQPRGSKPQMGEGIAWDPRGTVLAAGSFGDDLAGTCTAIFGATTLRGSGSSSMFAARLAGTSAVPERSTGLENPAAVQLVVDDATGMPLLSLRLARRIHLRIDVVDILGRSIAAVADRTFEIGETVLPVGAVAMASGTYFCIIRSDDRSCAFPFITR